MIWFQPITLDDLNLRGQNTLSDFSGIVFTDITDESLTATQVVAMGVVLLALAGIVVGQSGVGNRPRPLRR